jgi:hypothetical protein
VNEMTNGWCRCRGMFFLWMMGKINKSFEGNVIFIIWQSRWRTRCIGLVRPSFWSQKMKVKMKVEWSITKTMEKKRITIEKILINSASCDSVHYTPSSRTPQSHFFLRLVIFLQIYNHPSSLLTDLYNKRFSFQRNKNQWKDST